jgi:Bacteriophage protein GP30.
MTVNVSISHPYPGNVLSNLAPNAFIFEGYECASMEGLLQSFKFHNFDTAKKVMKLHGLDAKYAGRAGDGWKANQTLYWKGYSIDRHSQAYQGLLDSAYNALAQNGEFRKALIDSGQHTITHRVGHDDPNYTILTRGEFLERLYALRNLAPLWKD